MEKYLQSRPIKTPFDPAKQERLRNLAIEAIKRFLLPNDQIVKIILIGSSIRSSFGKYESPGFRGSLFSDFDFIIFVKDAYDIPTSLEREMDGKPFQNNDLNLAYRKRQFVEGLYDAEIFFIHESTLSDSSAQKEAELAGIPIPGSSTKHPFIAVYP